MRISGSTKPRVCISMGYPAGIGPEIISKSLASRDISRLAFFLIVGNENIFKKTCRKSGRDIPYKKIAHTGQIDFSNHKILFLDIAEKETPDFSRAKISSSLGGESIKYIRESVRSIKSGKADILVTAPINKHAAKLAGFNHKGHTEFLAYLTNTKNYAMMLESGRLKVFLATTHVPVRSIHRYLSKKNISRILVLANSHMRMFFKEQKPVIAVCGLNPHAGDNGLIGDEEAKIITPAIKSARAKGIDARGPLSADGVFFDLAKGRYDCVLCMYHDQGLVALKMAGRNSAVNITLGLPFIRTSPGHGTALEIAGMGIADPGSMKQAIQTAVEMYHKKEKGKRKKEKGTLRFGLTSSLDFARDRLTTCRSGQERKN